MTQFFVKDTRSVCLSLLGFNKAFDKNSHGRLAKENAAANEIQNWCSG